MSESLSFDVTMDCSKCKKALCDRIQKRFRDKLLRTELRIWKGTADDILDRIIKEELAR